MNASDREAARADAQARAVMRAPLTQAEALELVRGAIYASRAFGSSTVVIGRSTAERLIELLGEQVSE